MLTQDYLKSILDYNPETGIFTWKISSGSTKPGNIAGYNRNDGYILIRANNKSYLAHRLAWFYINGKFPNIIDHINRNKSDNRICNLREATKSQNQCNQKIRKNNTTGVKGVYFDKYRNKFVSELAIDNKKIFIGRFDSIELAEIAINESRSKYHKEFAYNGDN